MFHGKWQTTLLHEQNVKLEGMMAKRILRIDNDYITTVDDETGVTRKIKLESDSQFAYRNSLRQKLGKDLAKEKMPVFKASKSIDFMTKQLEKKEAQIEKQKAEQMKLI
jgi:hypothetical protein